jgi:hypothetical protein
VLRSGLMMPRYFFNMVKGVERVADVKGIELENEALEAVEWHDLLEEIKLESPDLFQEREGWSLEIVDEGGSVVQLIPLEPS